MARAAAAAAAARRAPRAKAAPRAKSGRAAAPASALGAAPARTPRGAARRRPVDARSAPRLRRCRGRRASASCARPQRAVHARGAAAHQRGPRRAPRRPRLDRARIRPARRDRVLQRRPAPHEPRDRLERGQDRGAEARDRPRPARRGEAGLDPAHPGVGRPARPRAARPRRGALPEGNGRASTRTWPRSASPRRTSRTAAGAGGTDRARRRRPRPIRRRPQTPRPTTDPTAGRPRIHGHPGGLARADDAAPTPDPPPEARAGLRRRGWSSADRPAVRPLPAAARIAALRATWLGTVEAGLARRAAPSASRSRTSTSRPSAARSIDRHGMELAVSEDCGHRLRQPVPDQGPGGGGRAAGAAAGRARGRAAAEARRPQATGFVYLRRKMDPTAGEQGRRSSRSRGSARSRAEARSTRRATWPRRCSAWSARTTTASPGSSTPQDDTLGGARRRAPARQGRARQAGQPGRDEARRARARTSS